MVKINKILVATDFSDYARTAVDYARELARTFSAELVLTHVVPLPAYPFANGSYTTGAVDEELRAGIAKHLDEVVAAERKHGIEVRGVLSTGVASAEIVELAKEEKADLIVVATHGYTGIKHVMLGSTAERVLRNAPCPVAVVPRGSTGGE